MVKTAIDSKVGNAIFDALPELRNESYLPHVKKVNFPTVNEPVYQNGDFINFLYFPIDCVFSTVAVMEDGSTVEINFAGNKSLVGSGALFHSPVAHFLTNVLIPGTTLRIECKIFQEIVDTNPEIKNALLRFYQSSLSQISKRAVCNGKHHLSQRLSTWLLLLFGQADAAGDLPLTHDLIAQKLGTRRAGITSAAGSLQAAGGIYYNRGVIRLLDRGVLERNACECYQLMKCHE